MRNKHKYTVKYKEDGKTVRKSFQYLRGEDGARAYARKLNRAGSLVGLFNFNNTRLTL